MGRLTYGSEKAGGSSTTVDFDDRTLAHLHLVMGAKLRRGQGFAFSWNDGQSGGNGRTSIWIRPEMPLVFAFQSTRAQSLNQAWVQELMMTANSPGGLRLIDEPISPG